MAYVRTNWVDYPNTSTPINAARLNNMEAGIAAAIQPGGGQIADADIAANAAIQYSKLALTGHIVDADIATNAAIQYAKLALALQIVNGDISPAAAIAISKLAGFPNDVTKQLLGDGSWGPVAAAAAAGKELDYAQITTPSANVSATTEATAVQVISGNSVTFDGTKVRVEFFTPTWTMTASGQEIRVVLLRDGTVVAGRLVDVTSTASTTSPGPLYGVFFETPSAGAHTYSVKIYVGSGGSAIAISAGAGGPGNLSPSFLRVTKA